MSTAVTEKPVVQAVFSVCASSELVANAMAAIEGVNGAVFAGDFQEYITASRKPEFPALLKEADVCVALVDCDGDADAALETMTRLQQLLPRRVRVVGLSATMNSELLVRAMRAGCSEFLPKPIVRDDLLAAVARFQAESVRQDRSTASSGKIIGILAAKGGVGATTLAVHAAVHLVKTHKRRVLLVDQKNQLGHVALYLGIKQAKYYFEELIRSAERLDAALLEGLVTHHSDGLDVIASPDAYLPRKDVNASDAATVLNYLPQQYDYVLVDSEADSAAWLSSLIRCSDEIALICTPDLGALRDVARRIEHLSAMDELGTKLRIVVNRSGSDGSVSKKDIEAAVGVPVAIEVPNNYLPLIKSINAGVPIGPQTRGAFTQAVAKWAKLLAERADGPAMQPAAKRRFKVWG